MLRTPRLIICLLAALAVVASGCGSTETVTTSKATSANAGTSAPGDESSQTATQSTSPKEAPQTSKAPVQKAAETNSGQAKGSRTSAEAPKPPTKAPEPQSGAAKLPKPEREHGPPYVYPLEARTHFVEECITASGSKSSCECMITKFESRKVYQGISLGEMLLTELQLRRHHPLLRTARGFAKECGLPIT